MRLGGEEEEGNYDFVSHIAKAFSGLGSCWPPDVVEDFTIFDCVKIIGSIQTYDPDSSDATRETISSDAFVDFADSLNTACGGLCLDCAKTGVIYLDAKCKDKTHRNPRRY